MNDKLPNEITINFTVLQLGTQLIFVRIIGVLQPQQVMTGEMVPCHQHRRPRDLERAEASVGAEEVVEVLVEEEEVDLVEEAEEEVDLVEEAEAEVDLVAPKDLAPAIQGALVEDNRVK